MKFVFRLVFEVAKADNKINKIYYGMSETTFMCKDLGAHF